MKRQETQSTRKVDRKIEGWDRVAYEVSRAWSQSDEVRKIIESGQLNDYRVRINVFVREKTTYIDLMVKIEEGFRENSSTCVNDKEAHASLARQIYALVMKKIEIEFSNINFRTGFAEITLNKDYDSTGFTLI